MKTTTAASIKKQTVAVNDLKTKKNPKGGIFNPGLEYGNEVALTPRKKEEPQGRRR